MITFIGKPLGKGTFGQVKQGTHILTGEKVCIFAHSLLFNSKQFTLIKQAQNEITDKVISDVTEDS